MGEPVAAGGDLPAARFLYRPSAPYDLALTGARFTRWPEIVDRFDGATYRRLMPLGRGSLLVTVRQVGPVGRPVLSVSLRGREARREEGRAAAERVVAIGLGAGLDVRAFYKAFRSDALLAAPLRHFRGLRIAGTPSLWEALVTAVLSQQVSLIFAYDMRRELSLAFGRRARIRGEPRGCRTGCGPRAGSRRRGSQCSPCGRAIPGRFSRRATAGESSGAATAAGHLRRAVGRRVHHSHHRHGDGRRPDL